VTRLKPDGDISTTASADHTPGVDARPAPLDPRRDLERYEIIAEHGRGGLGRVSRARDRELDRDVAIKELISRDPLNEVRFFREARITARLEHPGIVPIHETGRWPDGTPFYAMKLVAGRPLRDLIAERPTVAGRLGLLHHVIAVADAIAYAHGRGIIHRDLKPANVIVGDFGETIVIDWGLAKELLTSEAAAAPEGLVPPDRDNQLTTEGTILGTPAYMAPEQGRGEQADQRADVFAIGAMLWELCARHKVPPSDQAQRHRHLRRTRIDRDLITIIDKAIDPDRDRRYRDAGELAADLRAFTSGARIAARSYSIFAMLAHWARRHRMLALAAVAFVVLAAVAYRAVLQAQLTRQFADLSATQAEVEQGRQALVHGDSEEARLHLGQAYARGDHSSGVAFMLARALQPRVVARAQFASASGRMLSARFSADGRQIVTTDDGGARVWDAETHRLLFTLPTGGPVYDAVYGPDGTTLVTSGNGAVRIWNAATGVLVRALGPPARATPRQYYEIVISPDGTRVAAIAAPGETAHVWDARTGAVVAELHSGASTFPALAFSADGKWLAAGDDDDVRVLDTATWQPALTIPGPHIRYLKFAPTAPALVTGTVDGDVSIWAIPSGARTWHLRELGDPVDAVVFSPDGELVAAASRDGAEQVWNTRSGKLQSQLNYHQGKIQSLEFDASSKLLVASSNGAVFVSDAALGMPVTTLEGPRAVIRPVHFDPSSRQVVGASLDGTAWVWDATAPYRRWSSPAAGDFCGIVAAAEPDRRFVAAGCWGHPTRIWDTAHDQLLAELPSVNRVDGYYDSVLPVVSAAGDRAAIARDHTVEIYALPGGALVQTITHRAMVSAVRFAPAGHDLVSGDLDGAVLITRGESAPIAASSTGAAIDAAAILADGRIVASDAQRHVRVYDPEGRSVLADLVAPTRALLLRQAGNGRYLVTVPSTDVAGSAVLWDLAQYRLIAKLEGHVGMVRSARFVRNDREILTAGVDGTARLWDGETGRLLHTYRGSSRFLADATIDPGGSMVVTAGGDGLLRFWDLSNERLLWTLLAHKPHVIGLHFEGNDLVTRGFDGDLARWSLPDPRSVIVRSARNARSEPSLR
jgi:WD40 repeat protein